MYSFIAICVLFQAVFSAHLTARSDENGCQLGFSGDFSSNNSPQPVFIRNGQLLAPEMPDGVILNTGETITLACVGPGRHIQHLGTSYPDTSTVEATCVSNNIVSVMEYDRTEFRHLHCNDHPEVTIEATAERCYNDNTVFRVGYIVQGTFYTLYNSCFDSQRGEVSNVWLQQTSANFIHQVVIPDPPFSDDGLFPGINVNQVYNINEQRNRISALLGDTSGNRYVTLENHLVPHRLASSHNLVFEFGQRATFNYINTAPYWSTNYIRTLGKAIQMELIHSNYVLYAGSHGVMRLRDGNNQLVDIYLHENEGRSAIPVPLFSYLVAYEERTKLGSAFVCYNNPHMTDTETRAGVFCENKCENDDYFNFASDARENNCFCCDVNDFRNTVQNVPNFPVQGLLRSGSITLTVSKWLFFILAYVVSKNM